MITEDTQIENCKFNNSRTGILFLTPTGDDNYAKTGITDCEFWVNSNQVGIEVQNGSFFNDGYIRDSRFWFDNEPGTHIGIRVDGAMADTYISSTRFESFSDLVVGKAVYGITFGAEHLLQFSDAESCGSETTPTHIMILMISGLMLSAKHSER